MIKRAGKMAAGAAGGAVRFYRLAVSPFLPASCRFSPSCSAYTLEALERHGLLKGLFLGAQRILRCHPWSKHPHFDEVPAQFHWPIDPLQPIRYKRRKASRKQTEKNR